MVRSSSRSGEGDSVPTFFPFLAVNAFHLAGPTHLRGLSLLAGGVTVPFLPGFEGRRRLALFRHIATLEGRGRPLPEVAFVLVGATCRLLPFRALNFEHRTVGRVLIVVALRANKLSPISRTIARREALPARATATLVHEETLRVAIAPSKLFTVYIDIAPSSRVPLRPRDIVVCRG